MKPVKRSGWWYLIRRVPISFTHLDKRGIVRMSTRIRVADDPKGVRAQSAVSRLSADLEAYWRGLITGSAADAMSQYQEAKRRARALGFDYVPVTELRERPISEVVQRIEALTETEQIESATAVAAALGGVERPPVKVSGMLAVFEAHNKASLTDMSLDQLRKWRNPKKRAASNFIKAVSDKLVTEITRNDALDFREWWQERLLAEGLDIGTANKDIGHLNKMFRTINDANRLGLVSPFSELRISGEEDGQRVAYDPAFVQSHFLADGVFDALNDDARRIMFVMMETGLRLSEICNLTADTIHLDAAIPYISVRPQGRRMKTPQSAREIPLVGVALEALKLHPKGFQRYRHKADSVSALVNDVLTVRKLRPIEGQSFYSLRHTFEDRLTAVEAPEKLMASFMGHKYGRPKYGTGYSLAQKRDWLLKIAFRPPSTV